MRYVSLAIAGLLLSVVGACAQDLPEPIEARAKRLTPDEIPLLVQKANTGDLDSQALLWQAYSHGWGVPQDAAKGVPWLRMAAEKGSIRAMFELADLYENGDDGVPEDLVQGFQWMLRAAEKGHLTAQFNVAMFYRDGRGTKQDLQQSKYWLTKSAEGGPEGGFSHAQYVLGEMYFTGNGVAPDRAEAERWLKKALAQGNPSAMILLAKMYTGPTGVPINPTLVYDLYRAAAAGKNKQAEYELGIFYRAGFIGAPDYGQALTWLEDAARGRYAPAHLVIGEMYEKGQGVPPDWNQALARYHQAADRGVYGAIYRLGEVNRDGRNQPSDLVAAAMWFTIGSKMNGSDSQNALQTLNSRMKPEEISMAAARANTWWMEHPAAQQQQAGKPFRYQDWYMVGYPTDWPKLPPSTAQDRTYALQLTRRLEADPLSLDAAAGRNWLERWWWGIPDIEVRYCNLTDAPDHAAYEHGLILYHQTAFSAGAYILEHPSEKRDWQATYLVGLQGALRTYESILRQQPNATYRWLDDLRQKRDRGDLPETVRQLIIDRKCDVK